MVSAIVIALLLIGGRELPECSSAFNRALSPRTHLQDGISGARHGFSAVAPPAQIGLLADLAPPKKPLLQRLDGGRRAKVLSALAALIILGFALVLLAWLGARATRRYMHREPLLFDKPPEGTPVREKDWTEKPLDES